MINEEILLQDLNEEQKAAVTFGDGPCMIVAGAGTGKTTVITRRIAWLILHKKCTADEILALTFTEKAAAEMEERADRLLPYGYVNLWILTFHAFCERILRQHGLDIGLPTDFTLLNQTSAWLLVRKNLSRFNLDYYRPAGNPAKFIHALLKHFSRAKDEEIHPLQYLEHAESLKLDSDAESTGQSQDSESRRIAEIADAYHTYQQLLLENSALDFGDLIVYTLKLFRERPAILEKYRKKFKYILVDEFQDTNWVQYELVKLLSAPLNNITVVGDDDQAVYKFRGASLANILEFKKDFPQSREVFLVKNYRSGQKILDTAYAFIQQNNPNRLEYQLQSGNDTLLSKQLQSQTISPGSVAHIHCATHQEEVEEVLRKILDLKEEDPSLLWSDFAILVRSNSLANPFISACVQANIPYQFFGLKGLYTKSAIVDALAYFKVVENFHDGPALYRVFSFPFFDISTHALVQLGHIARKKGYSLMQAACKSDADADISDDDKKKISSIVSMIECHAGLVRKRPIVEVFFAFLKDTGYLTDVSSADTESKRDALNYLNQLFQKAKDFQEESPWAHLRDFMELVSLEQEAGDAGALAVDIETGPDAVRIMTIHGAKGLEFRYVFVVNMVDRRFPTIERDDEIDIPSVLIKEILQKGDIHVEEERRLFYVALTRAKDAVFLTSAQDYGGARKRKLSQFLHELGYTIQDVSHNVQREVENKKGNVDILNESSLSTKSQKSQESAIQPPWPIPSHFSFTQLAAFQKCPLQYKFSFLLHIPVLGKWQFSFGKTIHATLEEFFNSLMGRGSSQQTSLFNTSETRYTTDIKPLPTFEELVSIYERQWIDEWYPSQKEKDERFAEGKSMLARVYAELVQAPFHTTDIEKDFTIKIGSYPDPITIRGRIDRIDALEDGTVEIVDYKTGGAKQEEKLRSEDKEQLIIYQVACQEVLEKKPSKLTYWYLKDNVKVSFLAKEKELQKWKEKISQVAQDIRTSDFGATPGFHCKFCDYKDICEFRQM